MWWKSISSTRDLIQVQNAHTASSSKPAGPEKPAESSTHVGSSWWLIPHTERFLLRFASPGPLDHSQSKLEIKLSYLGALVLVSATLWCLLARVGVHISQSPLHTCNSLKFTSCGFVLGNPCSWELRTNLFISDSKSDSSYWNHPPQ